MDKRVFGRFNESQKWKDYFNFKSFECKMSFILTVIVLIFFKILDVYNHFSIYVTALQNITIYIAQALIGMLGIILAGIAIIVGILNRDSISSIEKLNPKKSIQSVLVSFEFLVFNIGIGIFLFLLLNLILYSEQGLIPVFQFYCSLAIAIYFLAFIVFYTISLTGNCIRVFYINDLYTDISVKEKSLYDEVNEVRIDYLLYCLHKNTQMSPEEIINDIDNFVESSNILEKEAVKNYLEKYYAISRK